MKDGIKAGPKFQLEKKDVSLLLPAAFREKCLRIFVRNKTKVCIENC
jgi:hypothetical protein